MAVVSSTPLGSTSYGDRAHAEIQRHHQLQLPFLAKQAPVETFQETAADAYHLLLGKDKGALARPLVSATRIVLNLGLRQGQGHAAESQNSVLPPL